MSISKKLRRKVSLKESKQAEERFYAVNRKIATDATMFATENALVFMLTALRDEFDFGSARLQRVLDKYNKLARCANEGYVKAAEVREQLFRECPDLKVRFSE